MISMPPFGKKQISLLEKLCEACSVSGDEGEVRTIVLKQLHENIDDIRVDALGNVLAIQPGKVEQPLRVMLAAHMDEVGFMVVDEEDREEGIYRIDVVGGIDPRQLPGKAVRVCGKKLQGVIGAKPIHLSSEEERKQAVTIESLRLDVGPGNSGKVKLGDRVTFASPFTRIGQSIRAKAIDDRIGVSILLELVHQAYPQLDLMSAFTVQEEVGLRGAGVAAYSLNPQIAIVVDCTPAYDLPIQDTDDYFGYENSRYNTKLGSGPAIYLADRDTLSDPRLVAHFIKTANEYKIPYQLRQPGGGGTDAGAIHIRREGIPTMSISVPGRYIHTQAAIIRIDDFRNTLRLLHAALNELSPEILTAQRG